MIRFIKKIFSANEKVDEDIDENLACAILLVEISYSDFEIDKSEIESMTYLFEKNFNLPREKSEWLRDKALNLHKDTNCLRQYIKIINEKFSKDQKRQFMNMAWEIARACLLYTSPSPRD